MIDGHLVINGLLFFNELDLLEIRLRELEGLVDVYLVVQSKQTHAGDDKPIYFNQADDRWARWRQTLASVVINPLPAGVGRWERENAPRHVMQDILTRFDQEDVFILTDADEIPRRQDLIDAVPRLTNDAWLGFRPTLHYYYLDLLTPFAWSAIALARVGVARKVGVQTLRDNRKNPPIRVPRNVGGWHFSWLGGVKGIQEKIAAYCHTELNIPKFTDGDRLQRCIDERRDLFDRFRGFKSRFEITPLEQLPLAVQADPQRWSHLLLQQRVA